MEQTAERFDLHALDGEALAAYRWPAAGAARGALLVLHGYAEHALRHGGLATAAAAAGLDVWAFDQRNHGRSPGAVRGSVDGFEATLGDVAVLRERALAASPGLPTFLFGHSMGGAIALRYALERPAELAGLVLSAPFLRDAVARPAWLLRLARPLARLFPTLPTTKLPPSAISRSGAEVRRYAEDPLIYHGGVRADAGVTLLEQGAALLERAPGLAVDTLVVHGSGDAVAALAGSRELAAASPRVELQVLEGGSHELHHDDPASGVPERVRRAVLDWLAARLVASEHA